MGDDSGSGASDRTATVVAENLDVVNRWVTDQRRSAWSQKVSLETRSIALISVNAGLAALFMAVQSQIGESLVAAPNWVKVLLLVGLVFSLVSIVAGVIAGVVPRRVDQPSDDLVKDELRRALDANLLVPSTAYVIDAQMVELRSLTAVVDGKVRANVVSLVTLALFAGMLLAAVVGLVFT